MFSNAIECPECHTQNERWRTVCWHCGADLPVPKHIAARSNSAALEPERPGCVTAYAVLAVIGGLVSLAVTLSPQLVLVLFGLAMSSFSLVLAYGLWHMKAWSRIGVIIFEVASTVLDFINIMRSSGGGSFVGRSPLAWLIDIVVSVYIVYWFWINKERFQS